LKQKLIKPPEPANPNKFIRKVHKPQLKSPLEKSNKMIDSLAKSISELKSIVNTNNNTVTPIKEVSPFKN